MSLASQILAACRQMIEDALERVGIAVSGDWVLPSHAIPPEGDTGEGFTPAPHEHEGLFDARSIWDRPISPAAPIDGWTYVWDAALSQWVLGEAGGGGGPAAAFKAYLTSNYDVGTSGILPMGNEQYDVGSFYDAASARWTPPAGPVAFMYRTKLNDNLDIEVAITKNGGPIYIRSSGRYSVAGNAFTESMFFDLANGDDYYEITVNGSSGDLVSSDTFWAGMVGGGGSGGGGTGGGGTVPPPFVYLVDSDGHYLVDSDGAYLYEAL